MRNGKSRFERSGEVQWLVNYLMKHKNKELITYAELSEECGHDVQKEGRPMLYSARRILQHEENMLFGSVHGKGVKLEDNDGVIGAMSDKFKRIRNAAARGVKAADCISDIDDLSNDQRAEYLTKRSYFSLLKSAMKPRKVEQIKGGVAVAEKQLNMRQMLKALQGGSEEE